MNKDDSYTMELDKTFYDQLLNMDFITKDDMVFPMDLLNNLDEHIESHKSKGDTNTEIEKALNHVHMEFVSTFYEKQKDLAEKIVKAWNSKLKEKYPDKKFIIEIFDEGGEYIIYFYQDK